MMARECGSLPTSLWAVDLSEKRAEEFARKGKIFLIGDITTDSVRRFLELLEIAKDHTPDDGVIVTYISSLGGDLFGGFCIYDALRACKASTSTFGLGVCASAALLALQGGDARLLSERAWIMLHEPISSIEGSASEIEYEANLMRRLSDLMVRVFSGRTGLPEEKIRSMMIPKETWLSGEEALSLGFVDGLVGERGVRKAKKRRR